MQDVIYRLFLFPHSVLHESAARCFLTVWPTMQCLRAIGPAGLPQWVEPLCRQLVPPQSDDFWERARNLYRGYQDLGTHMGEDGLMAVLSRDWAGEAAPETRSHIQSMLRGFGPKPFDAAEGLLMESVVFLEMAKDLDLRELELSADLSQVGQLEEKLLKALGSDEEDSAELQKALETTNPPLSPDWGHFAYLLRQRIGFWFRLLSRLSEMRQPMALAALGRDVVDEALDALQTARERQGKVWERTETVLLRLPPMDLLPSQALAQWFEAVAGLEERDAFHRSFEAFLREPTSAEQARHLADRAHVLEQLLQSLWARFRSDSSVQGGGYAVVLTVAKDVTYQEMWRSVDRTGLEALGTGSVSQDAAVLVHLEERYSNSAGRAS
ncbi:hypothetical protein [Desulfosoma sp.]|uniref:hypothetical protein n=1 Tax=Desulfosoma sp. TaxID=2603217 RepID=UPI004049E839